VRTTNTQWRAPTRALGAEDAFFKTINYSGELHALAYRNAVRQGDLSVDAIRNFVRSAPTEAVTRSKEFAITHTFQRELDELGGGVLGRLGEVGQSIQDVPMGRLIVPIIRTPTNLAHFATERTPILGMMSRTFRADIAAGGARASLALGKQAGGATLAAAFTYFGASEIITGGGPVDPGLRRAKQELTGWMPYSIRIGDTYYSFNRLEPLGAMLGIIADYSEIRSELPEWQAREVGQAIGLAASRNLADGRFLEGLSDFFDALEGGKPALERLLKGVLRVTTPAGGALRAVTRSVDPIRRETDPGAVEDGEWREARLILNEYKAQVPGYSTSRPPRRNLWGDPVEVPKGWGPDWLSPVYTSVRKNDPAGEEIVKLGKQGLLTVTRPKRVIFGADPEGHPIDTPASPLDTGIELTDAEYDDFVKLAGNETKIDGLGLHDKITELVTKDTEYREASDALQAVIVGNHIRAYRRAALVELLTKHEALMETYEKRVQTKARALEEERANQTPGRRGGVTPNIGR
jgi:hypothetical protein